MFERKNTPAFYLRADKKERDGCTVAFQEATTGELLYLKNSRPAWAGE